MRGPVDWQTRVIIALVFVVGAAILVMTAAIAFVIVAEALDWTRNHVPLAHDQTPALAGLVAGIFSAVIAIIAGWYGIRRRGAGAPPPDELGPRRRNVDTPDDGAQGDNPPNV
jgi:hypothetical protein